MHCLYFEAQACGGFKNQQLSVQGCAGAVLILLESTWYLNAIFDAKNVN